MSSARPRHRRWKIALVAYAVVAALIAWGVGDPPGHEVEYPLPGSGARVLLRFTPTHAFLAEYERSLIVVTAGGRRTEVGLSADSGGYGRGQLYEAQDGTLYYKGYFDAARIAPGMTGIDLVEHSVPEGARYLGAIDHVRDEGWRFLSPAESPEQALEATGA